MFPTLARGAVLLGDAVATGGRGLISGPLGSSNPPHRPSCDGGSSRSGGSSGSGSGSGSGSSGSSSAASSATSSSNSSTTTSLPNSSLYAIRTSSRFNFARPSFEVSRRLSVEASAQSAKKFVRRVRNSFRSSPPLPPSPLDMRERQEISSTWRHQQSKKPEKDIGRRGASFAASRATLPAVTAIARCRFVARGGMKAICDSAKLGAGGGSRSRIESHALLPLQLYPLAKTDRLFSAVLFAAASRCSALPFALNFHHRIGLECLPHRSDLSELRKTRKRRSHPRRDDRARLQRTPVFLSLDGYRPLFPSLSHPLFSPLLSLHSKPQRPFSRSTSPRSRMSSRPPPCTSSIPRRRRPPPLPRPPPPRRPCRPS